MTSTHRIAVAITFAFLAPLALRAQAPGEALSPLQASVACSPPPTPTIPGSASLHVIGAQDTMPRTVFGERDLLVLDGGVARGVQLGQRYFVRRPVATGNYSGGPSDRAVQTAGWIRVIAANENTAIASVDRVCGFIEVDDYLEPFAAPVVPEQLDRVDRSGELDFTAAGQILFGDDGRATAGVGDFMVVDLGTAQGVVAGSRFAVYRDVRMWMKTDSRGEPAPLPLTPIGEGAVVAADATRSVLRILEARDVVERGGFVVPRRP